MKVSGDVRIMMFKVEKLGSMIRVKQMRSMVKNVGAHAETK